MKVVVGSSAPPRSGRSARRTPPAGLAGWLLAAAAGAQELPAVPTDLADASPVWPRGRIEVVASTVPLFETLDGSTRASRVDMIWLPPRRRNLGLALGLTSNGNPAPQLAGAGTPPSVDLGLHWRAMADSPYRIDVTAWRRMSPPDAAALVQEREAAYGARLELQLQSSGSRGLVAERGFLGLQLESGARITVRRKHGGPMFYYRAKF